MRSDELRNVGDRVTRVLEQAEMAAEPEAKSDLACFACILTSALIEVACRDYVTRFVEKRAAPAILNFVMRKLYFFQNAKTDDIDDLLRGFDAALANDFAARIGPEGKDAIDSVVNNKNQLVHGKGNGLGLDTMRPYHKDVLSALVHLKNILTNPIGN